MLVSVVIRSRDEADRLRLTLASLAQQTALPEVIVVNDASEDHTPAVLAEAARWLPLRLVTHAVPRGRAGASNAGAGVATGDIVLFLDGDTLAHPELVARHAAAHSTGASIVARGETFHLRGTRFLRDPEAATPRSGEEVRIARLPPDERARLRVTRDEIVNDFAAIDHRAEPGVYPGAGPRRLYELEMDALRHHPDCTVLWVAAAGSNLSVRRDDFVRGGGFLESLDINEHRELALRLCLNGARMAPVEGGRTYHLTHRSGWRDPLQETTWEEVFYRAHPTLAVKLLSVFWASLSAKCAIPPAARIASLPELEAAARGDQGIDYDALRRLIPGLPDLSAVVVAPASTLRGRSRSGAELPMGSAASISIEAVVTDVERGALVAAAGQLRKSLDAVSENPREILLHFAPSLDAIELRDPTTLVIASLLPDVARDEATPSIEARWRRQLKSLTARPGVSVLIVTVFRHVPRSATAELASARAATTERIRRLNLLAAELSHDTGAGVIDIDRTFAHLGARALQTDYRLSGTVATQVAAHTIVWSVLSVGLDDMIAPEIQERAAKSLGAVWQVANLLNRLRVQRA